MSLFFFRQQWRRIGAQLSIWWAVFVMRRCVFHGRLKCMRWVKQLIATPSHLNSTLWDALRVRGWGYGLGLGMLCVHDGSALRLSSHKQLLLTITEPLGRIHTNICRQLLVIPAVAVTILHLRDVIDFGNVKQKQSLHVWSFTRLIWQERRLLFYLQVKNPSVALLVGEFRLIQILRQSLKVRLCWLPGLSTDL